MFQEKRFVLALSVLLLVVCIVGCGPRVKVYDVTGRVTINGQAPGEMLIITFSNPNNISAQGMVDEEGNYRLSSLRTNDGAMVGEYSVLISYGRSAPSELEEGAADYYNPIHPKYQSVQTSGLKAEVVKGGDNVFDFDIEANPEPRK